MSAGRRRALLSLRLAAAGVRAGRVRERSRLGSTVTVGLAALAVVSFARIGLASARDIKLRWDAPSSCPDGEAVRRRVLVLAAPEAALDAEARVTEVEGQFRVVLHVQVGDSIGERVLTAASCEAAAESVAVVLAMSGTALLPPPPPPPVIPPRAPPPPPLAPPPAPPARTSKASPFPLGVRVALEGAGDVGTLPSPTVGGSLRASLAPARTLGLEVGLAASVWLDQSKAVANHVGESIAIGLATFDAFACYAVVHVRGFSLLPCVIGELGRSPASGKNATLDHSILVYWPELGLGARARFDLAPWLAVALELQGVVPIPEQSFIITNGGSFTTSPLAGRLFVGPEVRF